MHLASWPLRRHFSFFLNNRSELNVDKSQASESCDRDGVDHEIALVVRLPLRSWRVYARLMQLAISYWKRHRGVSTETFRTIGDWRRESEVTSSKHCSNKEVWLRQRRLYCPRRASWTFRSWTSAGRYSSPRPSTSARPANGTTMWVAWRSNLETVLTEVYPRL